MRVLVCGSRSFRDYDRAWEVLRKLPKDTVIVSGHAPGADTIAERVALRLQMRVDLHPARWNDYGKRAGLVRNVEMLESGVDGVIAFWDGKSRGTGHTLSEAEKRGIPTHVEVFEGLEDE